MATWIISLYKGLDPGICLKLILILAMLLLSLSFILYLIRFISCSITAGKVAIYDEIAEENEVFPGYLSPQFLTFAKNFVKKGCYSGKKDTVFRHLRDGNSVSSSRISESNPSIDSSKYYSTNTNIPKNYLTCIPDDLLYVPEVCLKYSRRWNLYHGSLDNIGIIIGWASRLGYVENIIQELKLAKSNTSYVIIPQDGFDISIIETLSSKCFNYSHSFFTENLFKMLFSLSLEFEQKIFFKNILAIQLEFEPFIAISTIKIALNSNNHHSRETLDRCFRFSKY